MLDANKENSTEQKPKSEASESSAVTSPVAEGEKTETTTTTPTEPAAKKSTLLLAIETPIPGANPAGADAGLDPDFQAVNTEIQKLSGAGSPNFRTVVEKGLALTKEKTKDIRLLTWLCLGLFSPEHPFDPPTPMAREEFLKLSPAAQQSEEARYNNERENLRKEWLKKFRCPGLADGLEGLVTLCQNCWENLYPPRPKARANAFSWLGDRIPPLLADVVLVAEDKDPLERAHKAVTALLKLVTEKLPENQPKLSPLIETLSKALKRVPQPVRVTPATTVSPRTTSPTTTTASTSTRPESAAIDISDLKSALESVRKLGSAIRNMEPQNPVGYRLTRLARWAAIKQEPPAASPDGKTKIQGPQPQIKTGIESLVSQGNWAVLLERCEQTFSGPQGLYWLDLQRCACEAASGLGYHEVEKAILQECALFTARLPGLAHLKFDNGVPFADPQSQTWLEEEVRTAMAGGGADRPYVFISGEGDTAILNEFQEAQKLYDGGDLEGALMQIQKGLMNNPTPKSRFRRLLHLAMLCLKDKKPEAAGPILETLESEVEKFGLRDWDPELTLQVWSHLIRAYQQLLKKEENKNNSHFQEGFQRVFEKICQLDVRFALNTLEPDSKASKPKTRSISDGVIPTRNTESPNQPDVRTGHGGSEEKNGTAPEAARIG
ncbi:type VI secretion system protein TssA [candidate division KSB1 bacterium]|nr:type VI secretion system protein TssA [candidate division KSB1 bacterium]